MVQLSKPRVVIVGGGFGGINAAKALRHARAEVILIDKTNHHLFQPLLYQVSIGALSPGEIATPIRSILHDYDNTQVIMAEVNSIDLNRRAVVMADGELTYDYLILAPGARHSYFGKPEWESCAPGLKSLGDALNIRERVLLSFEKAERFYQTPDSGRLLTFVIIGGGPTGVEVAGAIAEIGRRTILPDFPLLKSEDIKVYLIEAGEKILTTFPDDLADYTYKTLNKLGVEIKTSTRVTNVSDKGVEFKGGFIETSNIIWAAGNQASPILQSLGIALDKAGRVPVNPDLTIPGHPDVFVIGDAAAVKWKDGLVPGVAQGAIQEGKYVARIIEEKLPARDRQPFAYHDKGNLATIGAAKAIADFGRFRLKGFIAWLLWSFVHIFFIIGFRNRLRIMIEWIWYYLTFQPGARIIVYSTIKKAGINPQQEKNINQA